VKTLLHKLQRQILLTDLRFQYILKNLSPRTKIIFIFLFLVLLGSFIVFLYDTDQHLSWEVPEAGGVLREGMIEAPRFINPVLAVTDTDRSLVSLIYSGLMRSNSKGGLIPDLAERYEVSEDKRCYKFVLKEGLKWSDNKPLTSDDVIFTIDLIKNPQTQSPRRASWEGVVVEKIDERNLRFCMERPYAPFLENTTIGIIPKHIWGEMRSEEIPLSDFNLKPIGSGPFKIEKINKSPSKIINSYTLVRNRNFSLGKPFIKKVIVKFFFLEEKLINAYLNGEIDSIAGISAEQMLELKKENSALKTLFLPRIFAVFFNQDNNLVFIDRAVREALDLAVDKRKILEEVLKNFGSILDGPLPPYGSVGGFETAGNEINHEKSLEKARLILKKSGWQINKDGVFEKRKKKKSKETMTLNFSLSTSNVADLVKTAELLKKDWEKLGARVEIKVYETGDLEQGVIRPRKYDALLFGEVLGRDPDPFAFWHSSQRDDPGLNVALYANITADKLLEEARTIYDADLREKKYREFEKVVKNDMPAVFLYSPHFLYILPQAVKGFDETFISVPSERFSQIYKWYLKTKRVWDLSFLGLSF
jgi:peptide/nickel transport system substrate-binding protein